MTDAVSAVTSEVRRDRLLRQLTASLQAARAQAARAAALADDASRTIQNASPTRAGTAEERTLWLARGRLSGATTRAIVTSHALYIAAATAAAPIPASTTLVTTDVPPVATAPPE